MQLRCVVITGVQRIEPKKNFAAWRQVSLQIAQKKIPFSRSPALLRWMVKIKIDRERRNPIELLTQIGQRLERFDPPDDPRNTEKIEQLGEKRYVAHVEAKDGMTKPFQDEQEKSTSAAEIEHALRRRAMQLQILHAFAIQAQPGIHVRVFGVPGGQAGVALLYFAQTLAIDACPQPPKRHAKNGALRSAPRAPVSQGMHKLADLTVKLHSKDW